LARPEFNEGRKSFSLLDELRCSFFDIGRLTNENDLG